MKIDYCFHTHTYRCGHAQGTDEEYVIEAIKAGIKILGFSDHVFLPNQYQPGVRGNYEQLDDYIDSIIALKEKYKNQIKILLGFECEYFDEYKTYYEHLKEKGFDYFILGQHFFMQNGSIIYIGCIENFCQKYLEEIEKAFQSKLFTYFAHPDLILTRFYNWCEEAENVSDKICKLAKKYDIPLEINLNGMTHKKTDKLPYPYEKFWEIAGKNGNKVVIGYDAHFPNFFNESKYIQQALYLVKKYHLKLIKKDKIFKLK